MCCRFSRRARSCGASYSQPSAVAEHRRIIQRDNHALQRTRRARRGCNRCVPCAGSLSLGRFADMRLLIALLCSLVVAQAADFWNGAVHYDPPFAMSDGPAGVPWPTNGWKFSPPGSATNGIAEVEFRLETVETFIDKAHVKEIRSVADLRTFVEDKLRATALGSYYSCSLIEVDGAQAVCCTSRTNQVVAPSRPPEWTCSVCFCWQTNSLWRDSTLCEIMINAEQRGTFSLLTNSLKTLKVRPENLPEGEH
jgi:hypothetical protein